MWSSKSFDNKNRENENLLENDQFVLLNSGKSTRDNSANGTISYHDLTISSASVSPNLVWEVLFVYILNDH